MIVRLDKSLNPRFLRSLVLLVFSVLLIPINGWFVLALAPLAIHVLVGFRLTPKRDVVRALTSPSLLMFPFCLALWARSNQVVSHVLIATGTNEFVGGYVFPGVIEVGWYEHSSAGLKYLREGVTPDIAPVMTDTIRRFQTFAGSHRVFDCFCIVPMYCRCVPVIEGWFSIGAIYAWHHAPRPFYVHAGPWFWGSTERTRHIGFHILVPTLLMGALFVRKLISFRKCERRLRNGECVRCGYNLTGNKSGICPECGNPIAFETVRTPLNTEN